MVTIRRASFGTASLRRVHVEHGPGFAGRPGLARAGPRSPSAPPFARRLRRFAAPGAPVAPEPPVGIPDGISERTAAASMRNSRPMAMSTGGVSAVSPHAARMRSCGDAGVAALAVHARLRPPRGGTG